MYQENKEPEVLTRRRFIATLAASAIAAGVPLPKGFPVETAVPATQVGQWVVQSKNSDRIMHFAYQVILVTKKQDQNKECLLAG